MVDLLIVVSWEKYRVTFKVEANDLQTAFDLHQLWMLLIELVRHHKPHVIPVTIRLIISKLHQRLA